MTWLSFGILWLLTVSYFLNQPDKKSIIIGMPNAEKKQMLWLSKPEKTGWDEFKERIPSFLWGAMIGAIIIFLVMV